MGAWKASQAAEGKIKGYGAKPAQLVVFTSDLVAHGGFDRVQTNGFKALSRLKNMWCKDQAVV